MSAGDILGLWEPGLELIWRSDELLISMMLAYAVPEHLRTSWGIRTCLYIHSASGSYEKEENFMEKEGRRPLLDMGCELMVLLAEEWRLLLRCARPLDLGKTLWSSNATSYSRYMAKVRALG